TEPLPGQVLLQVSAAFKGSLRRVTSNPIPITVSPGGTLITFSTPFYQFQYPSNYTPTQTLLITDHRNSPAGVDLYGLSSITLSNTISGALLDITIASAPNAGETPNAISTTQSQKLQTNSRPSDVITTTPFRGMPAVESLRLLVND